MYTNTSTSSLSGADVLFPAGAEIVGIAMSASTASYRYNSENNQAALVAYVEPLADTVFWASLETAFEGSIVTKGAEFDITLLNGRWSVQSSGESPRVTIHDATPIPDDSARSYVLVKFLTAGGETEWA